MLRKSILFIIFILICSVLVSAGPFRNISISVVDPFGVGVENAHVVMYQANNDYFNNEGYTGPNGVVVFVDVDARVWLLVENNTQGNTLRGSGSSKPVIIKQNGYSNRIAVKESVSVMSQASNNKNNKLNVIAVKESVKPEVNVVYRGSSNRDDRPDPVPMSLYHDMLFFFDISPYSGCTYNFIPQTYNRTFNFRNNPIELEFVVSDGSPIINLPEEIVVDEDDNHEIVLDLEDYINDFENDFNDLIINIESSSWSEEDGEIDIVDDELIINFFPALNLDYHVDNSVTFTISAEDPDSNYIEAVYTYEYEPLYKALHGNVVDLYFGDEIDDYVINIEDITADTLFEGNEFIAFFNNDNNAIIHLTKNDYYDSNRLIEFNEDTYLDFTIVPDRYNSTLGYDPYMEGYDTSFRWLSSSTVRYIDNVDITICDANIAGYNPSPAEVQRVVNILDYYYEATRGIITTHQAGNTLIATSPTECLANGGIGYMFFHWNNTIPGSGMNGLYLDGHVVIGGIATYRANVGLFTIGQEAMQLLGPHTDQDYIQPSIFCEYTCTLFPDFPTATDMSWLDWMYSRQLENFAPDTDPGSEPTSRESKKNKNVYDEVRYDYTNYINGEKVYLSKLLGYSPVDIVVKDESEILQREDLPDNAVIISERVSNPFPILSKKLFN